MIGPSPSRNAKLVTVCCSRAFYDTVDARTRHNRFNVAAGSVDNSHRQPFYLSKQS